MTTPKLLFQVDQVLRDKLDQALARREEDVPVVIGVSLEEANSVMLKLRNMTAGFRKYQPEGSELRILADAKNIRFRKEYKPHLSKGFRHNVYMVIYETANLRPSAAFAQRMEEFKKGLRSSPF